MGHAHLAEEGLELCVDGSPEHDSGQLPALFVNALALAGEGAEEQTHLLIGVQGLIALLKEEENVLLCRPYSLTSACCLMVFSVESKAAKRADGLTAGSPMLFQVRRSRPARITATKTGRGPSAVEGGSKPIGIEFPPFG